MEIMSHNGLQLPRAAKSQLIAADNSNTSFLVTHCSLWSFELSSDDHSCDSSSAMPPHFVLEPTKKSTQLYFVLVVPTLDATVSYRTLVQTSETTVPYGMTVPALPCRMTVPTSETMRPILATHQS
jgi:hypothetical protein